MEDKHSTIISRAEFLQQDIGCTVTDTEINSHISGYIAGKIMLTWNIEKGEKSNE